MISCSFLDNPFPATPLFIGKVHLWETLFAPALPDSEILYTANVRASYLQLSIFMGYKRL